MFEGDHWPVGDAIRVDDEVMEIVPGGCPKCGGFAVYRNTTCGKVLACPNGCEGQSLVLKQKLEDV